MNDEEIQKDLWRRAEENPMPLSEKIAAALFAAIILAFYFLADNETSTLVLMFMWFVAFSSSGQRRQQTQIDALRELLRRTTAQD
jgi:predicted MFS family arabinose efflux permease